MCPNMNQFDPADFSECHSEEVISFFWRSVYIYHKFMLQEVINYITNSVVIKLIFGDIDVAILRVRWVVVVLYVKSQN